MKSIWLCAALLGLSAMLGLAQTTEELVKVKIFENAHFP
jgi:hypothetical protein